MAGGRLFEWLSQHQLIPASVVIDKRRILTVLTHLGQTVRQRRSMSWSLSVILGPIIINNITVVARRHPLTSHLMPVCRSSSLECEANVTSPQPPASLEIVLAK